ncbi:MAG: hypothetical protein Q4Q06_04090 [Bacteroidota bacterium]|nr:hypothetical protein [Bacteroidota bacterium]
MKRFLFLVAFLFVILCSQAQWTDYTRWDYKYRFFVSVEGGMTKFLNKYGISMVEYGSSPLEAIKINGMLGVDNSENIWGMDFFVCMAEAKSTTVAISEQLRFGGIGLAIGVKNFISEHFFWEPSLTGGLLLQSNNIKLSGVATETMNRWGLYCKFLLGFGVNIKRVSLGVKGEFIAGEFKTKQLSNSLRAYQTGNKGGITAYGASLFLKVKF